MKKDKNVENHLKKIRLDIIKIHLQKNKFHKKRKILFLTKFLLKFKKLKRKQIIRFV